MSTVTKMSLLFLFFIGSLYAQVNYAKDYKTALKDAKAQDKQILLMLAKENCPACWWMKNIAFKDESLSQRINKGYITLIVDIHKDEIPMNLDYIGTPTFYFLTKDQDQRSRIDGSRNIKQFHERLDMLE